MDNIILDIDGVQVEHTLDENGNATLNGEIKFTKEQLAELSKGDNGSGSSGDDNNGNNQNTDNNSSTNPDPNNANNSNPDEITFDTILKASGINIIGEDGNPKTYDMTTEGFVNWAKDIERNSYSAGINDAAKELFKANPDLYEMYKYKIDNGTLEGYSRRTNLSSTIIDNNTDEQTLYDIIYTSEIAQGKTPDRAKKIADYAKGNNSLKEDAEDSLNILRNIDRTKEQARLAKAAQEERAAIEAEQKYFGVDYDERGRERVLNIEGSMYDLVVNKGNVGDMFIPASGIKVKTNNGEKQLSRKDIFDYMAKPAKEINGIYYTQAQIDEYNRMRNINEATKQYVLNLAGKNALDGLINKAVTNRVIKIYKNNQNNNKIPEPNANGNSKPKIVLPI